MLASSIISWRYLFVCKKEMSINPKNWWKMMKIPNIDIENIYILWTTWGDSMKFPGKMWLMTILKIPKK